jgi:hypothetical protein
MDRIQDITAAKNRNKPSPEILNSQLSILNSEDDDSVFFIPDARLRSLESIYCKMHRARQELGKMVGR